MNLVSRTNQKGFTLIEIAIVLVIVGLLLGMGASMIGPLTRRAKVAETKELVNSAVESVISFVATTGSLPNTATFPTIVRKPNDVWSNSLNYIYDSNLTSNICGRTSTAITINECFDTGCTTPVTITDVAFLIVSDGENFNNQTEGDPVATGTINVYTFDLNVDDYADDESTAEPYDDIVKWITIRELTAKVDCSGSELRILNNELPSGTLVSTYSASLFAEGGVPFADGIDDTDTEVDYEWCWQPNPSSPPGVIFTCGVVIAPSSTCNLITGTWRQCTSLTLSNTPTVAGSYKLTFFVRDEYDSSSTDDNIAQKSFVLTIGP